MNKSLRDELERLRRHPVAQSLLEDFRELSEDRRLSIVTTMTTLTDIEDRHMVAEASDRHEMLARSMAAVIQKRRESEPGIMKAVPAGRIPKGFWGAVFEDLKKRKVTTWGTPGAISNFWNNPDNKQVVIALLQGQAPPDSVDNYDTLPATNVLDMGELVRELNAGMDRRLAEIEERIMQRVAAIETERQEPTALETVVDGLEDPPLPPKTGKKQHGDKGDIRARIDSELLKLLDTECTARYGGNMSRTLDAILWRYYGRPRLSFELAAVDDWDQTTPSERSDPSQKEGLPRPED